ncbi:hypothetical protein CW710_02635 [Candidatus Bathyarchaeota archaeon]|nr:hypothetical protein [Candidatus Bathyarchaeota archaeon]RJS73903.1 MAG: hypothetical protein CW710_02635 [Candidatus Bathyarchaeota archaeon]
MPYLTITGRGPPEGRKFKAKVGALYSLAYRVKALMKRESRDFSIPKLEELRGRPLGKNGVGSFSYVCRSS